ncbi:MAG: TerB family tellurite resistance protein [Bacteroidia bacterium]|nr:TerB family tellurite resistance protein [Bacteroidia bacterium]
MIYKQFYSELGKLLYAVAAADGIVSEKEKQALLAIVRKDLLEGEEHKDEFGTNTALYSEIEFDFMNETFDTPEEAFNSFIDFITEHASAIDARLKDVCLRVTTDLGKAYEGINGKEKELIEKLKNILEKTEINGETINPKKKKRPRISQTRFQ